MGTQSCCWPCPSGRSMSQSVLCCDGWQVNCTELRFAWPVVWSLGGFRLFFSHIWWELCSLEQDRKLHNRRSHLGLSISSSLCDSQLHGWEDGSSGVFDFTSSRSTSRHRNWIKFLGSKYLMSCGVDSEAIHYNVASGFRQGDSLRRLGQLPSCRRGPLFRATVSLLHTLWGEQ